MSGIQGKRIQSNVLDVRGMIMLRMFKYRLYPTKKQIKRIDTTLGMCGWLYNKLLSVKIETYRNGGKSLSKFDLYKDISYFKTEKEELSLVYTQVLRTIADRIDKAFKNMFLRIKKGEKKIGKYKSFCYPQHGFSFTSDNKKINVSKVGKIKIKKHREIEGKIKNLTIKKTPTNKYYAIFCCEIEHPIVNNKLERSVGLDMGLTHFLTTSDGMYIENPRYLRESEQKLKIIQRRYSKKKKGSKNREKIRLKLARLHEKIANQRYDFTHKLSSNIVDNYGFIAIENLNVGGMLQNHHLSKSISDVGWGLFRRQLLYKAESAGIVIQEVDRFYPSSQLCSECGNLEQLQLNNRIFKCSKCGSIIDRDINASKNILSEGLRTSSIGTTDVKLVETLPLPCSFRTLQVESMKQEAPFLGMK